MSPRIGHGLEHPATSPGPQALALSDELQRLWRDVFDRGHAVAREPGGQPNAAADGAPDEPPRDSAVHPAALRRPPAREMNVPPVTGPVATHAAPVHVPSGESRAEAPVGSAGPATAPDAHPGSAHPVGAGVWLPPPRRESPGALLSPADRIVAPPQPVSSWAHEVVQVYRDGDTIAIVIRDLALDDAAAVRCAIETARQIVGDVGALRQVTLNGRRIYDGGPIPSNGPDLPRPPAVSFTC